VSPEYSASRTAATRPRVPQTMRPRTAVSEGARVGEYLDQMYRDYVLDAQACITILHPYGGHDNDRFRHFLNQTIGQDKVGISAGRTVTRVGGDVGMRQTRRGRCPAAGVNR